MPGSLTSATVVAVEPPVPISGIRTENAADRARARGLAFGLIAVIAFSVTLPATRLAVGSLHPFFVGLGRELVAACLAAPLLYFTRQPLPTVPQLRSLCLVVLGVIIGFPTLSAWAMQRVDASHGAVVLGLLPGGDGDRRVSARSRTSLGRFLVRECGRQRHRRWLCARGWWRCLSRRGPGFAWVGGLRRARLCGRGTARTRNGRLAGHLLGARARRSVADSERVLDRLAAWPGGHSGGLGRLRLRESRERLSGILRVVSRAGHRRSCSRRTASIVPTVFHPRLRRASPRRTLRARRHPVRHSSHPFHPHRPQKRRHPPGAWTLPK